MYPNVYPATKEIKFCRPRRCGRRNEMLLKYPPKRGLKIKIAVVVLDKYHLFQYPRVSLMRAYNSWNSITTIQTKGNGNTILHTTVSGRIVNDDKKSITSSPPPINEFCSSVSFTYFYYSKHSLSDVESMSPVMVCNLTIVFLYRHYPTTQNLCKMNIQRFKSK